jgi:hypothetical protein
MMATTSVKTAWELQRRSMPTWHCDGAKHMRRADILVRTAVSGQCRYDSSGTRLANELGAIKRHLGGSPYQGLV